MRYFLRNSLSFLILGVIGIGALATSGTQAVHAVTASDWNAGSIISDGLFYDNTSMSVVDIQNFLNSKTPTCDTYGTQKNTTNPNLTNAQYAASQGWPGPPYICLKDYMQVPDSTQIIDNYSGSTPNGSISAAQIIKNAADTYGISPKAIIVTLQKESLNLIYDTWPLQSQYKNAMGYGCPDTAPCSPSYAGFYNQVSNAAYQFSLYKKNPSSYRYQPYVNNSIQYNPSVSCGASTVYINNYATAGLYNYTPYQPDAAALNNLYGSGDSCSAYGNRNFWRVYNDWFGSTQMSQLFKGSTSGAVYTAIGGNKYAIPSMAILQDYGFDPNSVVTYPQATVDAMSFAPSGSGLSNSIGSIVQAPSDPTIYLISLGKKYAIQSMTQFTQFGFSSANIINLPSTYIQSIPTGQPLSNFIQAPDGSIFNVNNGQRSYITDYKTYLSLNPSSYYTSVSEAIISDVPATNPTSSGTVFLKQASSAAVFAYNGGAYYSVPSMDVFDCWGVNSTQSKPLVNIADNRLPSNFQATSSLSCLTNYQSQTYLLSGTERYSLNTPYTTTSTDTNLATLNDLALTFTDRGALKPYVQSSTGSAIYRLWQGQLEVIPTYSNYQLFGSPQFSTIKAGSLNSLPISTSIGLAGGQPVMSPSSGAVYIISGHNRYATPSSSVYTALRYPWTKIETYTDAQLSTYAAAAILHPVVITSNSTTYVADQDNCYIIPQSLQSSYNLGSTATPYSTDTLWQFNLSSCQQASTYIKAYDSATIYNLQNGVKHPIGSWSALTTNAGTSSPTIVNLEPSTINQYTTGSAIN